jgi:mannose-1-phosphate guanylyltransferase
MRRQTIHRAQRLIPPERLLTVVTRPHLSYAQAELDDRSPDSVIIQPCNRETEPGTLLPLLHVQRRDLEAIVAPLLSDHSVVGEAHFMVAVAAAFVRRTAGRLVLLGVEPTQAEIDYGWIEVGDELGYEQGETLYQVRRFWEKPSLAQARVLFRQGYLWNTMVVVGSVSVLGTLFQLLTPAFREAFRPVQRVLGSSRAASCGIWPVFRARNGLACGCGREHGLEGQGETF